MGEEISWQSIDLDALQSFLSQPQLFAQAQRRWIALFVRGEVGFSEGVEGSIARVEGSMTRALRDGG